MKHLALVIPNVSSPQSVIDRCVFAVGVTRGSVWDYLGRGKNIKSLRVQSADGFFVADVTRGIFRVGAYMGFSKATV